MIKPFFLLLALLASVMAEDTAFTLKRGAAVTVAIPADPSATEVFAAEELSRYLQRMLDAKVQISHGGEGEISLATRREGGEWWDRFPHGVSGPGADCFAVVSQPGKLVLRGGGGRGTLYSVYDVLEHAGCRWFIPGPRGEVVPLLEEFRIPAGERVEIPAFYQREISTPGGEGVTPEEVVDWETKNRLNRDFNLRNQAGWQKRGGTIQWQWIAHNYNFIIPADQLFQEKPEWFALYKGRRVKLGKESANVCTTNPEVIRYFSDFIIRWFRENPEGSVFPLSPPDGQIRWCECEECLKLGGKNFTPGPDASMSRRHLAFINAVAVQVGAVFPDRKILLLAYQNFVDPPLDMKVEPNVVVQPVNYGAFGKPMTHPANKRQRERFEGWSRIASPQSGTPGIWDYILLQVDGRSGPRTVPLPLARVMAENVRFLHRLGGRYYFTQAGPMADINPFLFYATPKLLWNPTLDLEALLDDFCQRFYGPAAGAMHAYWSLLEDAVEKSDWNPATWPEVTIPSGKVFTPEVLKEAQALLHKAESLASTPEQRQRIQSAQLGLSTAERSVSLSKPWRLARGKAAYTTNADATDDVESRVRGLAAERQNSGDPEGSLTLLINRLPKRDQKFLTLGNSQAEVAVLPGLGGRIMRFRALAGGCANVFSEPAEDLVVENVSQSYLPFGGYEEYLGKNFADPGWELAFEGAAKDGGLVLHASQGGILWQRRITLAEDRPALILKTTLKNIGPALESLTLRGHPQMTLDAPISRLVLCWKSSKGINQGPLSSGLPEQPLGAWAVFDPATGQGVIHRFDGGEAHLHLDIEHNTFNMETTLTSPPVPSGGEISLTQEWEIVPHGTLDHLQSKL